MVETLWCPKCRAKYRVGNIPAGSAVKCPKCGERLINASSGRAGRYAAARARTGRGGAKIKDLVEAVQSVEGEKPRPSDASSAHTCPNGPPEDGYPVANPVPHRSRLAVILGGAILLALVGIALAVLWPKPYDLAELQSAFERARGLVEDAMGREGLPIRSLGKEELLRAHEALPKGVEAYDKLRRRFSELKGYEEDDPDLRELHEAVVTRHSVAAAQLDDVCRRLWPGPGSIASMFARVSPSVPIVVVRQRGSSGSGFLVAHNRRPYVVTNRHVVEQGNHGFSLRFLPGVPNGGHRAPVFDVEPNAVVLIHVNVDLAVIRLDEDLQHLRECWGLRPLVLAKAEAGKPAVRVDDPVWVVGHPGAGKHGLLNALDKGAVSAITEPTPGDPALIRFTAPINTGNSGGPVLDGDGRVVGIAFAGLRGKRQMNLAVHVHRLHELLAGDGLKASFTEWDRQRILDPEKYLGEDHVEQADKLEKEGYRQCEWSGLNKTRFLQLASVGARQFSATKGKTYRILLTSTGFHGEVDIGVMAQNRLVYVKIAGLGELEVGKDHASYSSVFTATSDGRHDVILTGHPHHGGEEIPVYASVLEMAGSGSGT